MFSLSFSAKTSGIQQVGNTDGTTRNLVFVCRTDALAGGPDLGITASQFTGKIQSDVVRKNDPDRRRKF